MKKLIFALIVLLIATLPWTARFFEPETVLSVAVIDVTSADEQYKKRAGIYDVLNGLKFVNEDEQAYKADTHFYGVKVDVEKENIDVQTLPLRLDNTDLLYIADVAGIREGELAWGKEDSERMLHSGLTHTMWRTVQSRLKQPEPVTFIAEHSIFSAATELEVQQQVAEYLGVQHSGWKARYFEDLQQATMLKETSQTGSGIVFVHETKDESFAIAYDKPITVEFASEAQQFFNVEQTSKPYSGWFDVIATNGAQQLATFQADFSEQQWSQLIAAGVPDSWTAVAKNEIGSATSYYFAGDFSQQQKASFNIPKFIGYNKVHQWLRKDDAFYWHTYVPMMETILAATEHNEGTAVKPINVEPANEGELSYNARILGDKYEVLQNGKWQPITIKGVNIGMAKPGVFPGEAGIQKEDYTSWLEAIGEMGANTIRIYTIHPPAFYEALKAYNESHEQPIYVFHGVWIDEESLVEALDVYGEPTENFQAEIERVVDLIHGNATLEKRPGHASGKYTADISPYVLGWMLGIEWYPEMVQGTNETHSGKAQFNGEFFETKDASPFEIWLAEQFEFTASYEKEQYGWMRPFSFTNWVTTDLLEHPYEPSENEDMVAVNPNVIYEKGAYEVVGQFAAYHVYPYYPDFLNYTPEYINFKDHRGQNNNYAAYLNDLNAEHRLPIVISEFGIPASRGLTHKNPFGWNQGFIAEDEQGEILVSLYEDILHEEMLGGLIFTWQDEWFKRTWNTMDLDNPDQRPFWSNAQTNEQQFGLLSFDRMTHRIDGDTSDWFGEKPFYEQGDTALYVNSDERYVYLRLDVEDTKFSKDYYPLIYFDTLQQQGNRTYNGIELQAPAEFVLTLKGEQSRVEIDAYYDIFQKLYGQQLELVPFEGSLEKNSGQFNKIEFALNKQMTIPILNKELPFEKYETGKLRRGNGNPDRLDYDSLADYMVNEQDGVVEIRIPWLMLNVTDPGRREIWADIHANDPMSYTTVEGFEIGMQLIKNDSIVQSFPTSEEVKLYAWETWDLPKYEARLKESYYILQQKFTEVE